MAQDGTEDLCITSFSSLRLVAPTNQAHILFLFVCFEDIILSFAIPKMDSSIHITFEC